jgi:hypothetical protein
LLQKRRKRPNACAGNVVQPGTLENDSGESSVDGFRNPLLKKVGVVGVDVACQKQKKAIFHIVDTLKPDLKTVVFFIIKARNDFVVIHETLSLIKTCSQSPAADGKTLL